MIDELNTLIIGLILGGALHSLYLHKLNKGSKAAQNIEFIQKFIELKYTEIKKKLLTKDEKLEYYGDKA